MTVGRERRAAPRAKPPYRIDVQYAHTAAEVPKPARFQEWASRALAGRCRRAKLTLRLVDSAESAALNRQFRGQDKPTNVLSFGADDPSVVAVPYLGDLVICIPVVIAEAAEQLKAIDAHFAHMTVHGVLHLLGHDHELSEEAQVMETLERGILQAMGYADPYE